MKKSIFWSLVLFTSCLCACSTGDSDSDGGGITIVSYTMDCDTGPVCDNATNVSPYNSGKYQIIDCTWNCSGYNGQSGVRVSLHFKKSSSGCWELDNEFVSDGICRPEIKSNG